MCNRDPVSCMNVCGLPKDLALCPFSRTDIPLMEEVLIILTRYKADSYSLYLFHNLLLWARSENLALEPKITLWTATKFLHFLESQNGFPHWSTLTLSSFPPDKFWDKFNRDNFSFITFLFQIFNNRSPIRCCITYDSEKAPVQNKLRR